MENQNKKKIRLVATGGTIARRIVVQTRPRMIIAVACERDLTSGIQDSYPLPVFGILNQRPCGPCLDTLVSLAAVEGAVRLFLGLEDTGQPEDNAKKIILFQSDTYDRNKKESRPGYGRSGLCR